MSDETGRFLDPREMPDEFSIIDRIINVRFTRRAVDETGLPVKDGKEEVFVLRSDYEVVYTDGGAGYYFKKCSVKPSIKLKYSQKTDTTAIYIYLDITNFHAFSYGSDKRQEFSIDRFPIKDVEIHFGYLPQFPKFTDTNSGLTLDDYYDMTNENNTTILKASVFAVYPTKTPPDSVTQFRCLVGEMNSGLMFVGDEDNAKITYKPDAKSIMKDIFYENITKRFVREPTAKVERNNGVLSDADAAKYGVKVFLSDYLKDGYPNNNEKYSPKPPEDDDKEKKISIKQSDKLIRALENIRDAGFPDIRFLPCFDGNYIAYDKDEAQTPAALANSAEIKQVQQLSAFIPAIYSMTFGPTRVIKCPFFSFVYPLQEIQFQSRYNLSTTVGYFYQPEIGQDRFYAISCDVEFATVEDTNTMTLTNVDGEK